MLHNILLKAGEYTEIAKQGKFLNVVLAAGEITARIRMNDLSTFETKLVSGMAFPVPQGFQSVAFFSDTSQQTKIWLGNLPLTYAPMESKVVGSSALQSRKEKTFFNKPTITVESASGRGKIILQAEKDFFVGGAGMSISNSVKVKSGDLFSLNTQGAIYTYSGDDEDKEVLTSDILPLNNSSAVDFGAAQVHAPLYNHITDEVIFFSGGVVSRIDRGLLSSSIVIVTGLESNTTTPNQRPFIDNDNLVLFGFKSGDFCKSVISLVDYSLEIVPLVVSAPFTIFQTVFNHGDEFLVLDGLATKKIYKGNLDGASTVEVINSPLTASKNGFLLADGGVCVVDNDYARLHVTHDNGVTWVIRLLPGGITYGHWLVCCDAVRGYILYAKDSVSGFYLSKDNALSWEYISIVSGKSLYSLYCVDGVVFCGLGGGVAVYDVDTLSSEEIGDLGNVLGFTPSSAGLAFADGGAGTLLEFSGVQKTVGGMGISILEEIN